MMSQAELQKAYGLVEALTSFSVSCCDSSSTSTRKRLLLTCNGDTSISLINNREKACIIILFRGVCILETCISNDNTMPKASCWLSTLSSAKPCHKELTDVKQGKDHSPHLDKQREGRRLLQAKKS